MANITALLLVLMLTGGSAARVACPATCDVTAAASGNCHEHMTASGETVMTTGNAACAEVSLEATPFLAEHRAATGAVVLTIALSPTTPEVVRTAASAVCDSIQRASARPVTVLRL